jgi:hypothetical protein
MFFLIQFFPFGPSSFATFILSCLFMNHEFDFNVDNYSVEELEHFLKLDDTTYSFNELRTKCSALRAIIVESPEYDTRHKTRLARFIQKAEDKLVQHIKAMAEGEDGFIEDYNKLVIAQDEGHLVNQTKLTGGGKYVMTTETTSLNNVVDPHKRFQPMESYPTLIARSYLNGLKRKAIAQTIILNTLFRENYYGTTSTDFTIVLPYYFKNVLSLRLSSVQLPNVIYNVSAYSGNNTFSVMEDATAVSGTIVIPDGNYTDIASFTTFLQTQINTQLGISPPRFLVSYNPNSNKITISNSFSDFTLIFNGTIPSVPGKCGSINTTEGQREQPCVELNEVYKQFGWLVGFRQGTYSGTNTYTTEAIFIGLYPNYVYFVLNDYNNSQAQNVFGMYSKSIIGDNILGVLPITAQQEYSINFTTGNDLIERKREYFGPVRIQRLKIQIVNQYGDVIDLNNMDYSFTLELDIGYDI